MLLEFTDLTGTPNCFLLSPDNSYSREFVLSLPSGNLEVMTGDYQARRIVQDGNTHRMWVAIETSDLLILRVYLEESGTTFQVYLVPDPWTLLVQQRTEVDVGEERWTEVIRRPIPGYGSERAKPEPPRVEGPTLWQTLLEDS